MVGFSSLTIYTVLISVVGFLSLAIYTVLISFTIALLSYWFYFNEGLTLFFPVILPIKVASSKALPSLIASLPKIFYIDFNNSGSNFVS